MTYKVNEIFYSIQAEGKFSGCPAIFVRFSGCNLNCPWCDTDHEQYITMTSKEIDKEVDRLSGGNYQDIMVVFTGGEPTLQLKDYDILCKGYFKAIETNGLSSVPKWIQWITCSPKTDKIVIKPDELKFVYNNNNDFILKYYKEFPECFYYFIQPLEFDGEMNIKETVKFIKEHPQFRLSLQYHKLIGIR
ncbi:MAG: 7-carboxy-7-deazaguanine synthase QueE [Abditibacteriota bacterium]|nr:7-carboxy-7-deazaguanine synthase QueE [Abditibacteriota bacterium]